MKKILSIVCMLMLVLALAACSPEEPDIDTGDIANPITVSISFSDSTGSSETSGEAAEAEDEGEAAAEEVEGFQPIEETEFTVEEGSSVLEATQLFCVANNLDITIDTAGSYITGMLGLDQGATTGWIYTINGETVMVGANEQILQKNDKIAWEFIDFSSQE